MAIRSAYALGLHREETMVVFSQREQSLRRDLFRSLYILDRFLSASLGRPIAISEDDCSSELFRFGVVSHPTSSLQAVEHLDHASNVGLEASFRSCRSIGTTLKKVYSKRKISTKLAQQIINECKNWPQMLDPSLHWRSSTSNSAQGTAILHSNLFHLHAIILLTRPFFLYLLNQIQQERMGGSKRPHRFGSRMEKFSEACVVASCQSIILIQNARDGDYLPHRNPFSQ